MKTAANWLRAITSSFQSERSCGEWSSSGGKIVKVAAHLKGPCVVQALEWIVARAQPIPRPKKLLRRLRPAVPPCAASVFDTPVR